MTEWLIRDAKDCACIPESYFKHDFLDEFMKVFGQVNTWFFKTSLKLGLSCLHDAVQLDQSTT
jgi:hypothetical protein